GRAGNVRVQTFVVRRVLAADHEGLHADVASAPRPAGPPGGGAGRERHVERGDAPVLVPRVGGEVGIDRREDPRHVQPPAAVVEERFGGVGEIADAVLRLAVEAQGLEPAVDTLELDEAGDQPRLTVLGPAGVADRAPAGEAGEAGRAGGYPLDRFRPEADLFDVNTGRKVLRHGRAPLLLRRRRSREPRSASRGGTRRCGWTWGWRSSRPAAFRRKTPGRDRRGSATARAAGPTADRRPPASPAPAPPPGRRR